MVGPESLPPQFNRDPPITVTALVFVTDVPDHLSLFEMLGGLTKALQVIVITASGDTRYYQKQR